ncbi:MAG TPA: hypothetical protein VGP25_05725 [Gemmatimonadaceae bacterium]|nr:hypothetical protein [Gemmatimonadaceae bacterium]
MHPRRLALLSLLAAGVAACHRTPAATSSAPQRRVATADELAIYRVLAESTYVRSTGHPVAVLSTSLDSACGSASCAPLERRWGVESAWWASVADTYSARTANEALLRRAADTVDLRAIGEGHEEIIPIVAKDLPLEPMDTRFWGDFQYWHKGAAGVLRFSPIGFSASGRDAVVYLQWECGPVCGHTMVTALRADSVSHWRIADMLLLSSRQGTGALRPN